jgi:hypothetical protein
MSRLMSVALTEQAVREHRKTVTRRLGWTFLKAGDRLTLCRKVQGRKPGEPLERLAEVEVVSVRREQLFWITEDDVARECVPGWSSQPLSWAREYAAEFGISVLERVTRIEWRYL